MILRIKNWNELFENNRTRELKHLEWVPVPNRMDGDGYTELVDHPNGAAHFGAWMAILEIASRCDVRGTLLREGGKPHNAESLARISRLPVTVFEEVIPRLVDQLHWLEKLPSSQEDTENPQRGAGIPQEDASIPHDPALNGREGKGREEKERKRAALSPPANPTWTQDELYSQLVTIARNWGAPIIDEDCALYYPMWCRLDGEQRVLAVQNVTARAARGDDPGYFRLGRYLDLTTSEFKRPVVPFRPRQGDYRAGGSRAPTAAELAEWNEAEKREAQERAAGKPQAKDYAIRSEYLAALEEWEGKQREVVA